MQSKHTKVHVCCSLSRSAIEPESYHEIDWPQLLSGYDAVLEEWAAWKNAALLLVLAEPEQQTYPEVPVDISKRAREFSDELETSTTEFKEWKEGLTEQQRYLVWECLKYFGV